MTDHPTLFSGAMVRANNDGRKTQTRRLLTPNNLRIWTGGLDHGGKFVRPDASMFAAAMNNPRDFRFIGHTLSWVTNPAPHQRAAVMAQWQGKLSIAVGDRLWVREKWRTESQVYDDLSPAQLCGGETILYDADGRWRDNKSVGRARASMHMPRWASRTTLIVEAVRIKRLQDIGEVDAMAEGIRRLDGPLIHYGTDTDAPYATSAKGAYAILWNAINGEGAWEENPWVIAYTYRVIRRNIDQLEAADAPDARP